MRHMKEVNIGYFGGLGRFEERFGDRVLCTIQTLNFTTEPVVIHVNVNMESNLLR